MLNKLLIFNPHRRITVDDALQHPYLAQYYDPTDEPIAPQPFTVDMDIDNTALPQLKQMIFDETELINEQLQQKENN